MVDSIDDITVKICEVSDAAIMIKDGSFKALIERCIERYGFCVSRLTKSKDIFQNAQKNGITIFLREALRLADCRIRNLYLKIGDNVAISPILNFRSEIEIEVLTWIDGCWKHDSQWLLSEERFDLILEAASKPNATRDKVPIKYGEF